MAEPSISVMVPVFNGASFLPEALESVLAQTRPPNEVVVVDDGSTDESAAIASAYGGAVRVHRQPNRGIGAARNAALALAQGDLLAFLDADDVWQPRKLELQLDLLATSPELDIVFGHIAEFRTGPGGRREPLGDPRPGPLTVTMLIRAEALRRVGPFREGVVVSEYLVWLARARELGLREAMLPDVLTWRRVHDTNNGLVNRRAIEEYPRVFKELLDRRRAAR
jgi:glycosyltransferase involved in cell wall biosynthesis